MAVSKTTGLARLSQLRAWNKRKAGPILLRRDMVVFLPAVALAGLWFNLEGMFLLGITALLVGWMTRPLPIPPEDSDLPRDAATGLPLRDKAVEIMSDFVTEAEAAARGTACVVIGFDEPEMLVRQMHHHEFEQFLRRVSERISGALREPDRVAMINGTRFAILLRPTPRPDLESMIQLSARLQAAVEAPVSVGARAIHATCHIGFCLMGRAPAPTGEALLSAAEIAADEAERNGPSAMRGYSREVQKTAQARSDLSEEAAEALESGQIRPFYQPQISTDTGDIVGLQVVPRWLHHKRGILGERDITSAISVAGLQRRFAEVVLFQTFGALRDFDTRGANYGIVSLQISSEMLRDPRLLERLQWEFDRFEISPERICLTLRQEATEQLDQEIVAHNMSRIAKLGCRIELAGFGNGPVSVATIKRTAAHRMRIHRSFVTKIDQDPEQQRVVAAMISLCEGLGLQTLADGAATIAEHAMLGQLGCAIVQGNAIVAPMPLDELGEWARRHRAKLAATPRIDKRRGM